MNLHAPGATEKSFQQSKRIHRGAISLLASLVAVAVTSLLGILPAQASPICTATVSTMAELQQAMSSSTAQRVCLGADINYQYPAHVTLHNTGNITLDLSGHTLVISADNSHGAIEVPTNAQLTIEATGGGSLTATGNGGPGFGYNGGPSGSITINAGTITAVAGTSAAAIGGGNGHTAGPVTITGGSVTATGYNYGAGIGGGDGADGGTVTISGGRVIANGGFLAAGIGGGVHGDGGNVTISGGIVEATGDCQGSAIGGGANSIDGGQLTIVGQGLDNNWSGLPGSGMNSAPCHGGSFTGGIASSTTQFWGDPRVSYLGESSDENSTMFARFFLVYYYDIYLNVDGNSRYYGTIEYGGTADQITPAAQNPTPPAGYLFDTWRTGSPTGPVYDWTSPTYTPVTVYASWKPVPTLASTGAGNTQIILFVMGVSVMGLGIALLWRRRVN